MKGAEGGKIGAVECGQKEVRGIRTDGDWEGAAGMYRWRAASTGRGERSSQHAQNCGAPGWPQGAQLASASSWHSTVVDVSGGGGAVGARGAGHQEALSGRVLIGGGGIGALAAGQRRGARLLAAQPPLVQARHPGRQLDDFRRAGVLLIVGAGAGEGRGRSVKGLRL